MCWRLPAQGIALEQGRAIVVNVRQQDEQGTLLRMQTGMVDDDGGIVSDDPRHNTDISSLVSFDAENKRALDPEEKPHQFVERNSSKPLIILRMKCGRNTQDNPSDCTDDRYRCVHERRMEHNDCPWKSLMGSRKKSVRKMKLTRFYLRQNLEPLGSVCICVGSLPVGLEPSKYKTLIGDILGETMEYCEMKKVFPSYGMVFVFFPAADTAADDLGLFPPGSQPLIVLVNSRNGGGQGADMSAAFQRLLNPHHVYSLTEGGPLLGFYAFRSIPDFRVWICGGDDTVGWVLSCLDDVVQELKCKLPASAVLPLGTGNDLSRILHWGSGYSGGESPVSLLMAIDQAHEVFLDRWCVMFDSVDTNVPDTLSNDSALGSMGGREDDPSIFTMNNYFGIGIGAELCLDFHLQREEAPDKFHSRLHNKGVYFRAGIKKMVKGYSRTFTHEVEIEPDGTDLFHFVHGHQTWTEYLTHMEQDGTWGDHVILYAAANSYKTCIRVVSNLSHSNDVIITPHCPVDESKPLVLGHIDELHYVSLQPIQAFRTADHAKPQETHKGATPGNRAAAECVLAFVVAAVA
ncbi:Diacylglycerol kinase theta [Stylophora pistillata]|uniref:Diacylglycerol kinase n=1 Tax=Stylophora pistillata TaxID=50429 RepID=A0A2B4RF41_STYPI|nr:Diacylglycerol kinase theta [Stylophora pistillata]